MPDKLDLTQKLLCNKIGKMFELAADDLCYYEISFCKEWLRSDLSKELFLLEETLICQSKLYLYHSFKETLKIPKHEGYQMDKESMYWMGYLFTYWMFYRGIDGKSILKNYDLKSIIEQYDVLHTMSVKATIKTIEKDYTIAAILKDSILHSDRER